MRKLTFSTVFPQIIGKFIAVEAAFSRLNGDVERLTRNEKPDERIKFFTGQYIWSSHFEGKIWSKICEEIVAELPARVYVSLDIDGLTIECAPHNSTLIPGGLRFPEVVYLLGRIVAAGKEIVGFDLTEVVPDMEDKTDAEIAARMLFKLCSVALKNYDAEDVL